MWVYLYLWRLRPCGRNSRLCPRHSRSLGKWRNSPPPQMWCPAQQGKILKNKVWVGNPATKPGTNHSCSFTWAIREWQSCEKSVKYYGKGCDCTMPFLEQFSSVLQRTRGSGQKQSTHVDEQWAMEEQGNRRSQTHMHIYTYIHSLTAAKPLMSSFAKKSEQLVLGSK